MNIYWILFIVALCVSACGWKKFIYFISIGYGFSIAGCAVAMAIACRHVLMLPTLLLCRLLLFVYGCRPGGYLLLRELKSVNYRKVLSENTKETNPAFFATLMIWVSCALLYMAEVSPVATRLYNAGAGVNAGNTWD